MYWPLLQFLYMVDLRPKYQKVGFVAVALSAAALLTLAKGASTLVLRSLNRVQLLEQKAPPLPPV